VARTILSIVAATIVAAGVAFSLFNLQQVTLELGFGSITLPLGVLVLLALTTGALGAGILLWAGVVLPMRMRLRALEKVRAAAGAAAPSI
jgi:uncharacterized integral membrane protein